MSEGFPGLPLRSTNSGKHRFKEGARIVTVSTDSASVSDEEEEEEREHTSEQARKGMSARPTIPLKSPTVPGSNNAAAASNQGNNPNYNNNNNNNNGPSPRLPSPAAAPAPAPAPAPRPTDAFDTELPALPEVPQSELLSCAAAIQAPNVTGATPEQRTRNMQKLFNLNRTELFMVESRVIGTRVDPGSVRLIHLNNVPEMVTYLDGPREFRVGKGLDVREELGVFKESELYFCAKGMSVVNVPQGKYCLAWIGTESIILDQGSHVLAEPNLLPVTTLSLVDQTSLYIRHGNIHILRVPPGKLACVTLNNQPFILPSQPEPYIFRNPLFNFDPQNGGFVDQGSPYVRNGSLHLLQVPKGCVCTAWKGPRPILMYHREDGPYIIQENVFRVAPKSSTELFYSATEEIISHGSIKRIIPRTGHVAVVYQDGHLQVMHPTSDGRPIIIDHERASVGDMLNVQKQTLRFPSERTRRERERELDLQGLTGPDEKKSVNYELFTTSNGARYGVKLLVVFTIVDPLTALTYFRPEDIIPHVENLVVTEMNKAIQATESTAFLQTRSRAKGDTGAYENAQDEIKAHLHRDLLGVGIDVDRVSIEESVPIDRAVVEQMANFAVRNKKITLEIALLEREGVIAEQQSRQVAMKNVIMRQNDYQLLVERSQAELDVAKLQAQSMTLLATTRAQQLEKMGQLLEASPALAQLQIAQSVYGADSVLPQLNDKAFAQSINGGGGAVGRAEFFQSIYLPNPASLLNLPSTKEVGSSRVDLQACKLEYSIVSPK